MKEIVMLSIFLVVLIFACTSWNESLNADCRERGGKVINRPSELFDSCLEKDEATHDK